MKRIPTVLIYAVIGAIAGGALASLLVVLVQCGLSLMPERLLGETLRSLGIAGAIGGALGAILYGIVGRRATLVVMAGLCGSFVCCVLMPFATLVYNSNPWPSPRPYPGSEPSVEVGHGSSHAARTQTYTVARTLEQVRAYYHQEMARYCVSETEPSPGGCQASSCSWCASNTWTHATCRVRRLWREQSFTVSLVPASDQVTQVRQIDSWEH